jgi:serine/threonine-protein kinase
VSARLREGEARLREGIELQLQEALRERYRVDRELGAGGMGTVFLAEDLRHGRKVAIKVLQPQIAAAAGTDRFLREIRIAATLQHPGVLALIDSGEAGDLLYYVMPYVEGSSLRVRLAREGELPLDEALRLLREIAEALAHAHAHGVVHRDVKPENVLFTAGHAQLADFGIAKALGDLDAVEEASLTRPGLAIGSPAYMAPEAAAGDAAADHRADIYGFGVLAYEVLAGSHPFAGSSPAQMMRAHVAVEAAPLQRVRPGVAPELADLVMRCLAKLPAERWQSAAEVARRLDGILASSIAGSTSRRHDLSTGHFRLTERVCLRLRRESFDPRMIGDEIEYLDNGVRSDVLVCFLHPIGLDGGDFEPHLRALPYRGVAPTFYGFEPSRRRRFALPVADHLTLLGALLGEVARKASTSTILMVGFSSGGDLALRMAAEAGDNGVPVDGVLALGCNLGLATCFLTGILAKLESDRAKLQSDTAKLERGRGSDALADLRALAAAVETLDEWLSVHTYLVRMLRKFYPAVDPLREFAREIVAPFEQDGDAFAAMYRAASGAQRALRCLFEDTETCNRLLRDVQLRNLDSGNLGEHYREGSLLIEPDTNHFDLLDPDRVLRHLEALLAALGPAADRKTLTRA